MSQYTPLQHLPPSRWLFLLITLVVGSNQTSFAKEEPSKYALLVAVTTYDHAEMNGQRPLQFPEDDARALGKVLEKASYKVEYLLGKQATKSAIEKKLGDLRLKGNSDGICMVGFFGHGVEIERKEADGSESIHGCFCPVGTEVRHAVDKDGKPLFSGSTPMIDADPETLITMEQVLRALKIAKAAHRVVIADCCRELPNRARGRNLGLGASFKAADLPSGTVVLFGCKPGEKALERDDWRHGAFTKCLLEEIDRIGKAGAVTTGTLADAVKINVQRLTGRQQNPTPFAVDSIDLMLGFRRAGSDSQGKLRIQIDSIGRGRNTPIGSYSPDRKLVAMGRSVYDVPSNQLVLLFSEFSDDRRTRSFISSDGKRLLVEDFSRTLVFDLESKTRVREWQSSIGSVDPAISLYAEYLEETPTGFGIPKAISVRTVVGDMTVFFRKDVVDVDFTPGGQHLWITTKSQHLRYSRILSESGDIRFENTPDRSISYRGEIDAVLQNPDLIVLNRSDFGGKGKVEVFDSSSESVLGTLTARTGYGKRPSEIDLSMDCLYFDILEPNGRVKTAAYSLPRLELIGEPKTLTIARPKLDMLYSVEPLSIETLAIGSSDSFCPSCEGGGGTSASRLFSLNPMTGERKSFFDDGQFAKTLSLCGGYLATEARDFQTSVDETSLWSVNDRQVALKASIASQDGKVFFESTGTTIVRHDGKLKKVLTGVQGQPVFASNAGQKLVVRSKAKDSDPGWSLYDSNTGDVFRLKDVRSVIQMSDDGTRLVLVKEGKGFDGHVACLYDVIEKREIAKREVSNFSSSAAFSPRGDKLLLLHGDPIYPSADKFEVVNPRDGRSILVVSLSERASDVKWTSDGSKIIGAVEDGSIRWWNAETGEEIVRLYLLNNASEWIATTNDFRFDCSPGAQRFIKLIGENSPEVVDGVGTLIHTPNLVSTLLNPLQ